MKRNKTSHEEAIQVLKITKKYKDNQKDLNNKQSKENYGWSRI